MARPPPGKHRAEASDTPPARIAAMPSALPDGDPAPASGELPGSALAASAEGAFGIYVHVPFCSVRCGYCDFNTYTLTELGDGTTRGASTDTFADATLRELDLAAAVLGQHARPVETVFVGGGTPTMLRPADLVRVLHGIRDRWGLAAGAEVTTEANPDSVTPGGLAELAAGGFTRVSLGMQSAVPHVLAVLDRTHRPENVDRAVSAAQAAGLDVSLDLIYGTPGESLDDWRRSLDAALALAPDHLSAYALVVEEGTKLAAQVRRGVVPRPEDDDEAAKYELADEVLTAAGLGWYEVSNWARADRFRCRHNEGYWSGSTWWGVGPGAHSHVGGVRWWNVKHPVRYTALVDAGRSPAAGRETPDETARLTERVMLGVRLREGLPLDVLPSVSRRVLGQLATWGFIDPDAVERGRLVLSQRGRLMADAVVKELLAEV